MSTTAAAATSDVERAATEAVTNLREASVAAHERAAAIAALPSVVYGVATDQQTMLDLTADELSIHAGAGEIVEVAQQQLRSGEIVSLRKEGAGPLVHLPLATPGLHVVAVGDQVYTIAVVQLRPRDRANVVRGVVGVARRVDLAPVAAKLGALDAAVELRVGAGGRGVLLGTRPTTGTTMVMPASLGADPDPQLTLFVPPPHTASAPLSAAGLTLLALGLAAGVVAALRRRRSHAGVLSVSR